MARLTKWEKLVELGRLAKDRVGDKPALENQPSQANIPNVGN